MAEQRDDRSTTDQILDLLLDALSERQKARIAARQRSTGSRPSGSERASGKAAPAEAPEKPETGLESEASTALKHLEAAEQRPSGSSEPAATTESTRPTPDLWEEPNQSGET
ncbi:MAG: hypothetical protein ACK2U9_00610, partial [Anaerolineae bacterium]